MYSRIRSAVCVGMEGRDVCVETDIARGLPGIGVVGLPSATVMEARERIKSAVINSGFMFPRGRITVNLTPASLRKNSSCLDLPIAVGILASASDPSCPFGVDEDWGIIGELALDGRVLGIGGALPMMLRMKDAGLGGIIAPYDNRTEAALAGGSIYTVRTLSECMELAAMSPAEAALKAEAEGKAGGPAMEISGGDRAADSSSSDKENPAGDFGEIVGQERAKRAAVIAAAGRHGLLMSGSPGCGKTMIAERLGSIMPPMSRRESLEAAVVLSACGREIDGNASLIKRPFRAPHHSIGRAGLIGGGLYPVPGEITLAHNGVLFLDEICEFDRDNIEALRIPMEEKKITHFRRGEAYTFPCSCQIIMAANPCPCGFLGDPDRECSCTRAELDSYRRKLSGPIIDRIDMHISMEKVDYEELTGKRSGTCSEEMRRRVEAALAFAKAMGRLTWNSELSGHEIEEHCRLGAKETAFMKKAYDSLSMSPRSYVRTLKVARTIADLAGSPELETEHLAEALSYRLRDQ